MIAFGAQPTEWEHIGNQIDAALVIAWPNLVNML
jgi:hypothetical protein